jgi:outer membrane immunogenic protein
MIIICSAHEAKSRLARRLAAASAAAALGLALTAGTPAMVHAQGTPDLAQLMETVKTLEARVTTLEGDYKRAKQDAAAARVEAQALRKRAAIASAAPSRSAPVATTTMPAQTGSIPTMNASTGLYSMATKAPYTPADPGWGGFYAGAAFGVDSARARERVSETDNFADTFTETGFSSVTAETISDSYSFTGRSLGAVSSLSLGYNYMIDSKSVVGAQVEGGLTNAPVNLKGSGVSISNSTTVGTPPGGAAGTTVSTSTSTTTGLSDSIESRWLVSLLLRGGRLVDADDYVYLLGGYTYGHFEAEDQGFGLSGGTIGAGWERRIVPGWTVKAEYRYTRFQNRNLSISSQTSATGSPSTSNSSDSADVHYSDVDMHSVWLGVSHYFGTY